MSGSDSDVVGNRRFVAGRRATAATRLADHDPRESFGWGKEAAKQRLQVEIEAIAELQTRLFAGAPAGVLVVLQTTDAGGKDGTIRDVFAGLNPAGVSVHGFGVPTQEESAHDYLWRVHAHTPAKGQIVVFNRSHYEDVLVVRVHRLAPPARWRRRFGHIVNFERMLVDEGTAVVKLFLHLSNGEQRARLQDRVDDPHERWKFRAGDLDDRANWPAFQRAYEDVLRRTSTPDAPWYVVPADRKWVRNLTIAIILRTHLERIDPRYPPADPGIEGTVVV